MSTSDNNGTRRPRRGQLPEHTRSGKPKSRRRVRVRLDDASDDVGYGRPPTAHQFKPGSSGNPKGRPKGKKNEATMLDELLFRKITIREGGRERRITLFEGMLRRFAEDALKGNPKAAAFLFSRYGATSSGETLKADLGGDDQAVLEAYAQDLLSKAKKGRKMNRRIDEDAFNAILRSNPYYFAHRCCLTLNPGAAFLPNWHIEAILYQLDRVRKGEVTRLIINLPPRYLKSILVSVAFPAFLLGHNPARKIICLSYGGDLSAKHAADFRAIVQSPWYRRIFPKMPDFPGG